MNNEVDKKSIRKCPACGREYLKPTRYCEKCRLLLFRLSEYERLNMEANRATLQKMLNENDNPRQQNTPKCPTCGSTNVHPISTAKKATGFVLAGVFNSSFGKSYECENCKYKW